MRDFTGYTTNFACIYLNDEVIDCDDATHKVEPNEVMCKSDIKGGSQNCSGDSMSVNVTCESD
ncbi:hypothetical protein IKI14_06185 [bacterium]|nr:hypothetical protein [bacterium]